MFKIRGGWGGVAAYSFVACLSDMIIVHASLARRSGGGRNPGILERKYFFYKQVALVRFCRMGDVNS